MGSENGAARYKDVDGTITWTGQPTDTVWEILSWEMSPESSEDESPNGLGHVGTVSQGMKKRIAQVEVIARASSATGKNTDANAKAAAVVIEKMTIVTVTAGTTNGLPAGAAGDWNMGTCKLTAAAGKHVTITFDLRQYWNGTSYGTLPVVTAT